MTTTAQTTTGPCARCGARIERGWRFCGGCGAPRAAAPQAGHPDAVTAALPIQRGPVRTGPRPLPTHPPISRPTPVPGQHRAPAWPGPPAPSSGGPASSAPSWDRFVTGDWAGAALSVLAGLGTMIFLAGLAVVAVASQLPVSVPTGAVVAAVLSVVAAAVGGSIEVTGAGSLAGGGTSLTVAPLTITFVGFAVLTAVVLRRTHSRGARDLADVAMAAVRTWLVLAAALVVIGLVGRATITPDPSSPGTSFTIGSDVPGTLLSGTGWLALFLLVGVAWRRRDLLAPPVRAWRDRLAAPAAGVATTLVLSWLAAAGLALVALASDGLPGGSTSTTTGSTGGIILVLLVTAPNLLLATFAFALGVPLTGTANLPLLGSGAPGSVNLLTLTDQGPQYWLVPVLALVAVAAGGVVTALGAATPQQARRFGWQHGLGLAVLLVAVAINTGVSAGGNGSGIAGGLAIHLDYGLALVAGLVWGAVAGSVAALVAPSLPPALIARLRRHVAPAA